MKRQILFSVLILISILSLRAEISINARNRDIHSVFAEIMHQSGKNFVYSSDLLKGRKIINLNVQKESLKNVLDKLFAGTDVSYYIRGNNILLKKKKQSSPQRFILNGYVKERETGEALIGAFVIDTISHISSSTNAAGFYTMQIPTGKAGIKVLYPGYATLRKNIDITRNTTIDFTLSPGISGDGKSIELSEVVITADRNHTLAMESSDVGRLNLTRNDILSTPTVFGEPDVIKTIQLQPGVSAGVEGLAGMYVHGGNHDENLYMLDNVPLYQVNHFGGLFSAFNTEAIKNVDFYKSTFPAKYGGRLSSILEVHTKDGSLKQHHGSFRLGLTSGAFNIDGPIFKDKTSYSFAIRRSWFDLLTIPALAIYNSVREDKEMTLIAGYAFTDINLKINHNFSERSTLHGMFYFGEDYLKGGEKEKIVSSDIDEIMNEKNINKLRWGNIVGSIGWNYMISPTLFLELTGAASYYNSNINQESTESILNTSGKYNYSNSRIFSIRNNITDYLGRADFGWNPSSEHRIQFGVGLTYHNFIPQDTHGELYDMGTLLTITNYRHKIQALESYTYIGDDWDIINTVKLNAGVRAGIFSANGPLRLTIEPRASVRWKLNPQWTLKASYSRMGQFVHQLTESSISLPTDKWVPISGTLKPQISDKISLGGYFDLLSEYTFSIEAFYKWMRNIVDYRDDYFIMPESTPWDILLCQGSGRAKGIDFSVIKRMGKITGQISYSLLWSDRQFNHKNGGMRFPSAYDNRHKINITANWKINNRWELNAAWTGMSGNMITLPTQAYEILNTQDIPYFSVYWDKFIDLGTKLNNFRLPFYHRLDVSANHRTKHGLWNFSLYNAYCNMNVITIKREISIDSSDHTYTGKNQYKALRLIPLIPSVSYTWYF